MTSEWNCSQHLECIHVLNRISVKVGEMIEARSGVKIVSYIFFDVHGQSTVYGRTK